MPGRLRFEYERVLVSWEEEIGQLKLQRHVIALHEGARINRYQFKIDDPTLDQLLLEDNDGIQEDQPDDPDGGKTADKRPGQHQQRPGKIRE